MQVWSAGSRSITFHLALGVAAGCAALGCSAPAELDAGLDGAVDFDAGGLDASNGEDASGRDGAADGGARTDGGAAPDGCSPRTECLPDECGARDDGCGGTLECGPCAEPACVRDLAAGFAHTCSIDRSARVQCWGTSDSGAQGERTAAPFSDPGVVPGVEGAVQVEAGFDATCARLDDGEIVCWGSNAYRLLADGTTTDRATPAVIPLSAAAVDFDVRDHYACAALAGGAVECWGSDPSTPIGSLLGPTSVEGVDDAVRVAVGPDFACALGASGRARCWGRNTQLTLGAGLRGDYSALPLPVPLADVVEISAHSGGACARTIAGAVYCWGGSFRDPRLEIESGAIALAQGGGRAACAAMADGTVLCWGSGSDGLLGTGDDDGIATPEVIPALAGLIEIELGNRHGCGRTADDEVRCWGRNGDGELGFPGDDAIHAPAVVAVTCDAACVPRGCAGATCGMLADGCGGSTSCGACGAGESCGRLVENACAPSCTAPSCGALGATCGGVDDGCGGSMACGACTAPATCGGAGAPTACGCDRAWTIETPALGGTAEEVDLAVDGAGLLHVVWNESAGPVRYSHRLATGAWTPAETIGTGTGNSEPSIAVDASGAVHVAFQGFGTDGFGALIYATGTAGSFTAVIADSAPLRNLGTSSDIAVDASGVVHIAHAEASSHARYCVEDGAGFACRTISDGITDVRADDVTMAVDAAGAVHFGFRDDEGEYSIYALLTPAGDALWRREARYAGDNGAIAVSSDGAVHYVSSTPRIGLSASLSYARRDASGEWQRGLIDTYPPGSLSPSLAIGPDGSVHVLYMRGLVVRHAQRNGPAAFSIEDVESLPAAHPRLVIASDSVAYAAFAGSPFTIATGSCL